MAWDFLQAIIYFFPRHGQFALSRSHITHTYDKAAVQESDMNVELASEECLSVSHSRSCLLQSQSS